MKKRAAEERREEESSSEDEDFGPQLGAAQRKPKRRLKKSSVFLSHLPNFSRYTRSYPHSAPVTHIVGGTATGGYFVSASEDGVIKFWKKSTEAFGNIESVKQFQAHDGRVTDVVFSPCGRYVATTSAMDLTVKVFEVATLDMINIVRVEGLVPRALCWINRGVNEAVVGVTDQSSGTIAFYDPLSAGEEESTLMKKVEKLHKKSVGVIVHNSAFNCMLTCDDLGMVEYWSYEEPATKPPQVLFEFKAKTDLFKFRKVKSVPLSVSFSRDETRFAVWSSDQKLSIFDFAQGRVIKEYNESIQAEMEMQQGGTSVFDPGPVEFGRRVSVERDLIGGEDRIAQLQKPLFDDSGNFVIYGTLLGIKVVNLVANTCSLLLGQEEPLRFLSLALYQGRPKKKQVLTAEMVASENKLLGESEAIDPVLIATAYNKNRIYIFSRFDGVFEQIKDRDACEGGTQKKTKKQREEEAAIKRQEEIRKVKAIVLHTSMGDIRLKLYPQYAPLAVENFVTHCRNGYYNGLTFHRIVKGFMIQGGDPSGDGTGGESIWGKPFSDEFTPLLRHDRPFILSMANAGKNTNGSQFFITTEKAPWLDDVHTIFGSVISGMENVKAIEKLPIDRKDRPHEPPVIVSTTVE
ncbi:hypothetical protein TRVA0_037S00496 [Trichomonascus vanleenenianus]|uniref:WD40 repeat domain-containing peptidylprolyl isomerase n=1 Tax=Trichomonascus vanleenenianus TaxID=2268995 RepID=UPI003ECB0C01